MIAPVTEIIISYVSLLLWGRELGLPNTEPLGHGDSSMGGISLSSIGGGQPHPTPKSSSAARVPRTNTFANSLFVPQVS